MPTSAQEMVTLYTAAELAVLKGQRFRLGEREFTRADLSEIRKGRQEWERRVAAEAAQVRGSSGYAVADFSGDR